MTEASLGGLRRHITDLMKGLDQLNVQQGLAYAPGRADSGMRATVEWCDRNGIPTFTLDMTRRIAPVQDTRAILALLLLIGRFKPQILHLHSSKAGGVGRIAALFHPGLRVVYTPNGAPANLSRFYRWIEVGLGRLRTDRLIAVSATEWTEFRAARYVPPAKVARVDSGIDLAEVRRQADVVQPSVPSPPLIVAVGRLTYQKDPLFIADASGLVLRDVPEAHFMWVGDGELRRDFEVRLRDLGVADRWFITGWVPNPFPFVKAATVSWLSSRYESFGYVTLEAMALGKPVVATRAAGTIDIIVHGESGYLVEQGDIASFGAAIISLLREPALARRMGTNAMQRAQEFRRDRMASQTAALYESLVGTSSR